MKQCNPLRTDKWIFINRIVLLLALFIGLASPRVGAVGAQPQAVAGEARDSDNLLDDLGRRAFEWFQCCRHPRTGLVLDRARESGPLPDPEKPAMASIASVGYALSLLPEAVRLGYISKEAAIQQAQETLHFLLHETQQENGLYWHFVDWRSGKRWRDCEVSTLDSAILFNGIMVVSGFGGQVQRSADEILDRADWTKFLMDHEGKQLLSMGSKPEKGLLNPAGIRSSEMAMPYFLAIGSRTHAIDPQCWYNTKVNYGLLCGRRILNAEHPLFTSYYGLGWHPLQGFKDRDGVNLWENAAETALANRAFCREEGERFPTYAMSEGGWWGISAGDSPKGYIGPSVKPGDADGVVWPTATLAALPWAAEEIKADLSRWRASSAWRASFGPHGLRPFRIGDQKWEGTDLIGIDVGSFAVSLANYRNQTIWRAWAEHPIGKAGLAKVGVGASKPN
jgi:hypothetical protein